MRSRITIPDIRRMRLSEPLTAIPDITRAKNEYLRNWFLSRDTRAALFCCMKVNEETQTVVLFEDCRGVRIQSEEERYTLFLLSQILHLFCLKEYV